MVSATETEVTVFLPSGWVDVHEVTAVMINSFRDSVSDEDLDVLRWTVNCAMKQGQLIEFTVYTEKLAMEYLKQLNDAKRKLLGDPGEPTHVIGA